MKIQINSGFQRGGTLWKWTGKEFVVERRAAECTWVGDTDSSFEMDVPEGFQGIVTRFWGVSSLSYCCNVDQWIGFSEVEMKAPIPVKGWASKHGSMCRTTDDWRVETFADWAQVQVTGASFTDDATLIAAGRRHPVSGEILVHIGMDKGDQPADFWAVYSPGGEIVNSASGCGDSTPQPVEGKESWEFTSQMHENHRFWQEEDDRMYVAMDRAKQDAETAEHLRYCYRQGMNPLPTLRRKIGGTWTFARVLQSGPISEAEAAAGARLFFERMANPSAGLDYGWTVKHVPQKGNAS